MSGDSAAWRFWLSHLGQGSSVVTNHFFSHLTKKQARFDIKKNIFESKKSLLFGTLGNEIVKLRAGCRQDFKLQHFVKTENAAYSTMGHPL